MTNPTTATSPEAFRTARNLVSRTASDSVAASSESIWRILSDDFLDISAWAGGVTSSTANPATPTGLNGSPHGGRVCDVDGLGLTDERIVAYDADRRLLSYDIAAKKLPFFVTSMGATWSVQPGDDPSSARVTLTVEARTKGLFGGIGKIPLGRMLSGTAPGLLGDLKTWAEARGADR